MSHQKLFDSFKEHQIPYVLHNHQPLFTVEEAKELDAIIGEPGSKNLFLKDKKKNWFLLSTLGSKRVDLKALAKVVGNGGFSFGNADDLLAMLGVTPGSVTPYGLINDNQHRVTFLLDKELTQYEMTHFHPLRNDMTVSVPLEQFLSWFKKIGCNPQVMDIPEMS